MEAIASNIFSQHINKPSLFKNKNILNSTFIPPKISFRDVEIEQAVSVLSPALRNYKPNNIFIYGTCGTGKTVVVKYVLNQLEALGKNNIKTVYVNCKMKRVADTEYRLLACLLRELGVTVPDTGLPTDVLYRRFFEKVDSKQHIVLIVLDEIDTLFNKVGDEFLYNLIRINNELKNAHISIVGITNNLSFREGLDVRIRSSLGEEEILFKPYNAIQLKNILSERIAEGFCENVVSEDVLGRCAALAAQEHGDARRALDMLRTAGELAERMGDTEITDTHVDLAEKKIDLDRVVETIKAQPKQSQAVLCAIMALEKQSNGKWSDSRLLTGNVFLKYKEIVKNNGLRALTQRRISDLIGELDMLGVITAKVISKGRYGRTREISLAMADELKDKVKATLWERFL
ncbi:MAG: orc1/cdc6 family replication initiation protein [Candidatus Aenigmatarchaeota archaeon]